MSLSLKKAATISCILATESPIELNKKTKKMNSQDMPQEFIFLCKTYCLLI